jgi:hypothetical protein
LLHQEFLQTIQVWGFAGLALSEKEEKQKEKEKQKEEKLRDSSFSFSFCFKMYDIEKLVCKCKFKLTLGTMLVHIVAKTTCNTHVQTKIICDT